MQFSFIGTAYVLQLHSCGTENLYRRYLYEGKSKSLLYCSQEQTFLEDSSQSVLRTAAHSFRATCAVKVHSYQAANTFEVTDADSKVLPALFSCSLEALNLKFYMSVETSREAGFSIHLKDTYFFCGWW